MKAVEKRLLDPISLPQVQWPRVEGGFSAPSQKWGQSLALLMLVLLMALAGCSSSQPDLVAHQLVDAVNGQNLNGALRLFASDAVVGIGSSASFSGQAEIEQWLKGLLADNLKLNMQHAEVQDNQVTADFTLNLDSVSGLGITSLAGTGAITVRGGRITELHFTLNNESQAGLLKARLNVGSPRLTYAALPDPSPLRVNQGSRVDLSSFTVLVTNSTAQPVEVIEITFRLPEGDPGSERAVDLTNDPGKIMSDNPNGENWKINSDTNAEIRLEPSIPGKGQLGAGEGLYFTIYNIPVNTQPGSWDLKIDEVIGDGKRGSTKSSTTIQLAKLPPSFYVGELKADSLIVNAGDGITLSWSGSENATYTIKYWDGTHVISDTVEGPVYQYPVENLQETTTFYLIAEAAEGEKVVTLQRDRTVTVIK
jgi:hypothetical protein